MYNRVIWILDILVLYGYNDICSNVNRVMLYISVVWLLLRNIKRVNMWYVSVIWLVNVIDLLINDICNNYYEFLVIM